MTEIAKRKAKRKSAQADDPEDARKLTPDEEAVAKALLWELPSREGKLAGMKVRIFLADEAVEFLLKSRFAAPPVKGKSAADKVEPVIRDAKAASQLLSALLCKGLFQRAVKLQKEKRKKPPTAESAAAAATGKSEAPKEAAPEEEAAAAALREKREKKQREKEEKRKRGRPRLDIHEVQAFVHQAGEVYIWHYDPTRPRNVVLGFLLVIGSILLCLFPMWPLELRTGTYYLSIGALCLLGGLISLALARFPLFGLVWCLSFGRLQFWFLPNLTEDVGILESFLPVISCNWSSSSAAAVADATDSSSSSGKKTN